MMSSISKDHAASMNPGNRHQSNYKDRLSFLSSLNENDEDSLDGKMNQHSNVAKAGGGGPNIGIAIKQVNHKSTDEQDESFDNNESISVNRVEISKFGTQEYHRMQTKESDQK